MPTLLYFLPDGNLIYRDGGEIGTVDGFLAEAKKAVALVNEDRPMAAWEGEYNAGRHDPIFLRTYLLKRADTGNPNGDALRSFLDQTPRSDWKSADMLSLIAGNLASTHSEAYPFLCHYLLHQDTLSPVVRHKIMDGIERASRADYRQAVANRDTSQLDFLVANQRTYESLIRSAQTVWTGESVYRLRFYYDVQNWLGFDRLATRYGQTLMDVPVDSIRVQDKATYQDYLTRMGINPDSLSHTRRMALQHEQAVKTAQLLDVIAETYANHITDSISLNKALIWSSRALELVRGAWYINTHALLLNKLGRKQEAIQHAREAVELARAKGFGVNESDIEVFQKTLAQLQL